MSRGSSIDHHALFADVISVVRTARAPTAGWRTVCVRARRALGTKVIDPLSDLDLDEEVGALSDRVRAIACQAPDDIDTLVFGLAQTTGPNVPTAMQLGGLAGFDPALRWLPRARVWSSEVELLASSALETIARVGADSLGEARKAITTTMRFGAGALLGRFAAEGLPYRVVVAFDEGDWAAISEASG